MVTPTAVALRRRPDRRRGGLALVRLDAMSLTPCPSRDPAAARTTLECRSSTRKAPLPPDGNGSARNRRTCPYAASHCCSRAPDAKDARRPTNGSSCADRLDGPSTRARLTGSPSARGARRTGANHGTRCWPCDLETQGESPAIHVSQRRFKLDPGALEPARQKGVNSRPALTPDPINAVVRADGHRVVSSKQVGSGGTFSGWADSLDHVGRLW
jgi:hypothetical protein